MKQLTTIFVLLTLTAITAFGQTTNKTADSEQQKPYIEVTGTAEKEIIPDEIYIAITIRERQEGKETITVEKQEADLKAGLVSIGVSLDNLSLADANANYIRIRWTKKDVVVKSEYLLKVGDAVTVGKVFEKLDELKILGAYISKVSHSKIEELKKEVRIMAIKAAKEKADYLLGAIGEQTGKPLIINEVFPAGKVNDQYLNIKGARSAETEYYIDGVKMKQESDKAIEFEKINLQALIYVKFEIK